MNKLFILTGPAGVGKSTISYELGKRLEKSVVIEGGYNIQLFCWWKNKTMV